MTHLEPLVWWTMVGRDGYYRACDPDFKVRGQPIGFKISPVDGGYLVETNPEIPRIKPRICKTVGNAKAVGSAKHRVEQIRRELNNWLENIS